MTSLSKIDVTHTERTASAIQQMQKAVDAILDAKRLEKVFGIKQVIFNDPATIVMWADGTKSVVKAQNETFDPEKGLATAIARKALGNKHNYYDTIRKHTKKYKAKK